MNKELDNLKQLLTKYSRFGEGLTTKNLREKIYKLENMKTLSKSQIDSSFINFLLPEIKNQYEKDGIKDIPARCEAYNNYVDNLHKNGQITEKQANKYCIPKRLIN